VRIHDLTDRYFRVTYLCWTPYLDDGRYGDCQYYEFPGQDGVLGTIDDKNLLVDGGYSDKLASNTLDNFLNAKLRDSEETEGTLHYMLLSSPGEDHYSGLDLAVQRYHVLNYYENVRWKAGWKASYDTFITHINTAGCNVYYYEAGEWLSRTRHRQGTGLGPLRYGACSGGGLCAPRKRAAER